MTEREWRDDSAYLCKLRGQRTGHNEAYQIAGGGCLDCTTLMKEEEGISQEDQVGGISEAECL